MRAVRAIVEAFGAVRRARRGSRKRFHRTAPGTSVARESAIASDD
jgi:hypothetical protein